jgi:hypothetical protein
MRRPPSFWRPALPIPRRSKPQTPTGRKICGQARTAGSREISRSYTGPAGCGARAAAGLNWSAEYAKAYSWRKSTPAERPELGNAPRAAARFTIPQSRSDAKATPMLTSL